MIDIGLDDMRNWFGFGVAGNFAGHLEQAGEDADFVNVSSEGSAPKGIFPWYAPGTDSFLSEFPLSTDAVVLPDQTDGPLNLQIEPEVGLACQVVWDGDTVVTQSNACFAYLGEKFGLLGRYGAETMTDAIEILAEKTTVDKTEDGTILISVLDTDPQTAADMALLVSAQQERGPSAAQQPA